MGKERYSEQFKREAIRLVLEEGYSNKAAGNAVGVCHTSIRAWIAKYGDVTPTPTVYASKDDELDALRKENVRLRMERDILKKATAFFAQTDQS